jgi:hypothetical protein
MNETTRETESEPKPKTLIREKKKPLKNVDNHHRLIEAPHKEKARREPGAR